MTACTALLCTLQWYTAVLYRLNTLLNMLSAAQTVCAACDSTETIILSSAIFLCNSITCQAGLGLMQPCLAAGTPPPARSAHAAAAYQQRYLLVFGGGSVANCFGDLYVLDTDTMHWSCPATQGPTPMPRAGTPKQLNISSFAKEIVLVASTNKHGAWLPSCRLGFGQHA